MEKLALKHEKFFLFFGDQFLFDADFDLFSAGQKFMLVIRSRKSQRTLVLEFLVLEILDMICSN